ncbi:MAG: hypothetical protein COV79_03575, partial [Parcubacteria group bacterium CG11_big_fil_rev_8_21_14_0_20_41_14]
QATSPLGANLPRVWGANSIERASDKSAGSEPAAKDEPAAFLICVKHDMIYIGMQGKTKYKIKELPLNQRPQERLMEHGPDTLRPQELLAIIIRTGYKGEGVLELSSRILQEYGSKAIIKERNVQRLMDELGIPKVKACQIISCFELGRRFYQEDTGRMPTIRGADDVYEYLKDLQKMKKEVFRGLYLNGRNKLIHDEVVSIGTLNANLVHPREVYQAAIEFSASAVIVAHNHPSGESEPSEQDKAVTLKLRDAGALLGIALIDHVIIGRSSYTSLKEQGMM